MENRRLLSPDIIKGIAMIMVILVHYEQSFRLCNWFAYFQMGCPIFFVASGFNIMCLIHRRFGGHLNRQNIRAFYDSRYKALAPAWYLAFLIIFTINTILLVMFGTSLSFAKNRDLLSIVCNLFFLHGFLPFCNNNVMPGGWYIGTTAILYLLTPLILTSVQKCRSRRHFFLISSAAGMLLWVVLKYTFRNSFSQAGFNYYFFPVHYPNYLLGVMLYFDLSESMLTKQQVRQCLPLGFMIYAVSVILFFSTVPSKNVFSAWMTALATYLVLYFLLSNEQTFRPSVALRIISAFGRNSYPIYLLHGFWAWSFVPIAAKILKQFNANLYTIPGFLLLLPLVLSLSYFTGYILGKVVRNVSGYLFKND